jgi:CRP-like cAMP-binding protein
MQTKQFPDSSVDSRRLAAACLENSRESALGQHLLLSDWVHLLPYLQPTAVAASQVLISQGAVDRTVYFVESGSLSVHYEDAAGRIHLAVVGAGSAVGEGSFFSHKPRNATVQAASASRVWTLTPQRFAELANHNPATALAVTLALGGLVATRALDRRRRISVT